jgi:hypothetical protein
MTMEALECPKCGAPLQVEMTACPYCRVGLVPSRPTAQAQPEQPVQPAEPEEPAQPAPVEVPQGWVVHRDPWNGFTLAHPQGWEVLTFAGQTSVRADPNGLTSANLNPFSWPTPVTAQQLAQQYINLCSRSLQNFQAWQQGNVSLDSNRVTLRLRATRYGQALEGIYNILAEGSNCIISGYQALPQHLAQAGPVMAQILSTFRTAERMPRQVVQEPMEGAYRVMIPEGWGWRGGVDRNNIGGSGRTQFSTGRDAQGTVMAAVPNYQWNYMDGFGGFFPMPGSPPSMRFMPAAQFIQQVLVKQMRQYHPDVQVESVVERLDWAEYSQFDLARNGYMPGMFDVSVAIITAVYTENGLRLREKSRVGVMRQRGIPMWSAIMDMTYRAPENEFAGWEPVLAGIVFSQEINPQWKAGERNLAQNYINNGQADIRRRQAEISRTLSETSDIISNSYWNRQASYDRISEMRSNATLGVQNVASDSGDMYKVPYGFDRYWADGLGNLYGGSWLSQPDINWTPLAPTGI